MTGDSGGEALSGLRLEVAYRSDAGRLVSDFYVPCLKRASLYRRAVGYFTSSGLAIAAQGIAHLIATGGSIRLVASPVLTAEDAQAIANGYANRFAAIERAAYRGIQDVTDELTRERLSALAWLIAEDRLDVRIALRMDGNGVPAAGIYHEKIGIFTDIAGNHVAFVGSPNETVGGLASNFESLDVYWSWDDAHGRVARKIDAFERLWSNATPGLEVLPFTDVSRELLKSFQSTIRPACDPSELVPAARRKAPEGFPVMPTWLTLKLHQEMAISNWFANGRRGTLKMATGSGKTITALALAARQAEADGLRALIVVCPFQHLVIQWAEEARKFGLDPILAFVARERWEGNLNAQLFALRSGTIPFVSVVTTNRTLCDEAFQFALRHFPADTLIVGDEAHNLGATDVCAGLPENIRYRIALSATPERWFDDTGSRAVFDYFGTVLEPEYTLGNALLDGVLTPYEYHPILVDLTEEETDEYIALSGEIARVWNGNGEQEESAILGRLLAKRSRLIGSASGKIGALRSLMPQLRGTDHTLFYCGDGSVEGESAEGPVRQVAEVTRVLGAEFGYRVASYTFETSLERRGDIRRQFEIGDLQGLVAIRCLDEGVDIPSIERAVIMASGRNPRQFIQRRGRILRRFPGKQKACIYDMIVVPTAETSVSEAERSLVRAEFVRFREFANLATNAGQALSIVVPLQAKLGLLDV